MTASLGHTGLVNIYLNYYCNFLIQEMLLVKIRRIIQKVSGQLESVRLSGSGSGYEGCA